MFYSAVGYTRDIEEAMRAGADAYLIKPVSLDELEQAVARLDSLIRERDFEARLAEIIAGREELAIRRMEKAERIALAKEKWLCSPQKSLRLKAEIAFLAAGGTRADFARRWPAVLVEEVRNHRDGG